jgi:hypothetical protein
MQQNITINTSTQKYILIYLHDRYEKVPLLVINQRLTKCTIYVKLISMLTKTTINPKQLNIIVTYSFILNNLHFELVLCVFIPLPTQRMGSRKTHIEDGT